MQLPNTQLLFYIGSHHKNSFLNNLQKMQSSKEKMIAIYLDKIRFVTPKQIVTVTSSDIRLKLLRKNKSFVNVERTINKTKLNRLMSSDRKILIDITDLLPSIHGLSYALGYKQSVSHLYKFIDSIIDDIQDRPNPVLIVDSDLKELALDLINYYRITPKNTTNPAPQVFINNVLYKNTDDMLEEINSENIPLLKRIVTKEFDELGFDKIQRKEQSEHTETLNEDEKRRLSIEAPITIDFNEANKTSKYNIKKIIGTDKLSGLRRTITDFRANMASNMQDMIDALKVDDTVNIRIHKVNSTLIDTFQDRYMEYTIVISHEVGYNKPYPIKLRVPVPNDSGYFRIGGNDYILLSQLFSKSMLKIKPDTVNLITNFGLATVNLKSTKIDKRFDYSNAIIKMCELMKIERQPIQDVDKLIETLVSNAEVTNTKFKKLITHVVSELLSNHTLKDVIEFDEKNSKIKLINGAKEIILHKDKIETSFNDVTREFDYNELGSIILTELDLFMFNKIKKHLISSTDKRFANWINMRIIGIGGLSFSSIIAIRYGLKDVLDASKIRYTISDSSDKLAYKNIKINNKYVCIYAYTINEKTIANSITKHDFKKYPLKDLTDKEPFEKVVVDKYNTVKLRNLKIALEKFIDKNTMRYLVESQGTKPDLLHIVCESMVQSLLNDPVQKVNDLNNYRIRQSEIIPQLMYKQLAMVIGKFKNLQNYDKKLDLDPNYITKELQSSGMLAYTKGINPIEELSFATRVTKSGAGSVKADLIMIDDRVANESYFGNIAYSNTPEYSNVGVIQHTTLGLSIKNKFGDINVKKPSNDINPIEFISTAEANIPYLDRVNPNRAMLALQQQTQVVTPTAGGDKRLVQSGIEHVMNQMVSGRFIRRSPVAGTVVDVNDKTITIKDKFGNERVVSIMNLISRTKRGVYLPLIIRPIVKKGQKVKKNDIIASHISFDGQEYAPNKMIWVAFNDDFGSNYEDGWAVSERFLDKFESTNLQKIDIVVPQDVNILFNNLHEGTVTKSGEILFEYESYNISDALMELQNTSSSNISGSGLTINGNKFTYRSSGGKIMKIVVRIPTKENLHSEIKKMYNESTKHLKALVKSAEDNSMIDLDKSDLLSNIDDLETLQVKPFRYKNNDFEGQALITVYLETPLNISKGDKFTISISGGKGTITKIIPNDEAPITEITKQQVDMLPLTLGVFKRKNLNIIITGYSNKIIWGLNEISKRLLEQQGVKGIVKVRDLNLQVFAILDKKDYMLDGIKSFFKQDAGTILKAYRNSDSMRNVVFPLIVSPFDSGIKIEDLHKASQIIKIPLDEKLVYNKIGFTTDKPVSTFPLEIQMLEHFSDYQGTARGSLSTKRSVITGSGVSGSSAGKSAQKIGTYTLDSLLTEQPIDYIKELQIFKSDNKKATKWLQTSIIKSVSSKKDLPSINDYKIDKKDITGLNLIKSLWLTMGIQFETE